MSMFTVDKKVGAFLAATAGVAFIALTSGCASQQSGAATPANLPHNCKEIAQNVCKGMASCKERNTCRYQHSCKGNSCRGKHSCRQSDDNEENVDR